MKNTDRRLKLYSKDEQIKLLLEKMKENKKIYFKVLTALQILGDFENKVEINSYDIIKHDKCYIFNLWLFDKQDNLFAIYPVSNDKRDLLKITKEDNNGPTMQYDLSLLKNNEPTYENIGITKSQKTYNTKFGRLITDNSTFFSLFLGNNNAYQIEINYLENNYKLLTTDVIDLINKLEAVPSFMDFKLVFEKILSNDKNIRSISLKAFNDFELIGSVSIECTNHLYEPNYSNKTNNRKF